MSKEEVEELFLKLIEVFPWTGDCTTRFDCIELGEPKSLLNLFQESPDKVIDVDDSTNCSQNELPCEN